MSTEKPACFYPPARLLKKMRIDDKGSRGMLDGIRRAQKRKRPPMATSEIDTPTQKR